MVFITKTAIGPGAHLMVIAAPNTSLTGPGVGWGCCEFSPQPGPGAASPHRRPFHLPVPSTPGSSQPFLYQESQELEKNIPMAAGHHLLKQEHPFVLSRTGSKLGLGILLLRLQGSLGCIFMLPRHLESRSGGAGEEVAPGG